ncbi:hypothetical protein GALMADRAFT_226214 [Galerina marginata CBS 339.88]|uniref:Uncharacterized protein n=1 Tax=Galerina marginata (strain CBS 339.88) TaxID=685588 RepID=A0A067T6P5_GALM3|nr:hypothetical protein GALMADRAFT_226214 [Galerina marginata CBS 339.88]
MASLTERKSIGLLTVTRRATSEDDQSSSSLPLLTSFDPSSPINTDDRAIALEEEKVMRRLVDSWMDRLQLISVLAIFFASTEATLLSITVPAQGADDSNLSLTAQAANAGLTGGLVLHILAAFISFIGGFFLIRYKIKWARVERNTIMKKRQSHIGSSSETVFQMSPIERDLESGGPPTTPTKHRPEASWESMLPSPSQSNSRRRRKSAWVPPEYPALFCSFLDFRSKQVYPATRTDPLPTKLLGRFHFLCVVLTLLGFIFTLIGIVCNTWERLPHVVGVVCTITIFVTLIIVISILIFPDTGSEEPK